MTKAIFKNARYILVILLIYFIICEIFLRIFWKPAEKSAPPHLENPHLSPRVKYFIDGKDKRSYLADEGDTILKANNMYISRWVFQESMEKPDNIYRIFFIGGSAVHQSALPYGKTSWKIAEDSLNKQAKNIRFECINFGINGAFTDDSLALIAHEIIHYDPDMIVVMHAINDLSAGLTDPELAISSLEPTEYIKRSDIPPVDILRGVYQRSYVLMFLKRKIYDRLRNADSLKSEEEKMKFVRTIWRQMPKKTYAAFPSLDNFKKNIKSLIGIAKAQNIRICFMTQPSLYSEKMTEEEKNALWLSINGYEALPDIPTLYRGMNLYNGEVKRICEQYDAEYIDLAKKIPKDLRYLFDHVHYTPEGARLVGEIVGDYLWDTKESAE
jgi:lysophospholipase L1-like esterase